MTTFDPLRSHGGPDRLGVPLHDFSTNGNACGPCPDALAAVRGADAARYPEPLYGALRQRLAQFHGVAPWRIVPAASGSEFIARVTAWTVRRGGRSVRVPPHGYGDYAAAARSWGLSVVDEGVVDLAWACEPSSPLGAPQTDLQWLPESGRAAVLDRAYEPLRLEGSLSLAPELLDRFWQLWTPNKALGLTGIRAAYAVAPSHAQDAALQLEAFAPSWPLGAHGVAMLQAWSEPGVQQWLADSRATLRQWKERQTTLCREIGLTVLPGQASFFVCPTGDGADRLAQRLQALRGHGIKLRDCASFGLPGHVRLSVQPPPAQDALRRAWEAIR